MSSINVSSALYLKQTSGTHYYSSDNINWTPISAYPLTINNTVSPTQVSVIFTTNMTFTSGTQYFIINSNDILVDGEGYTMTISSVTGYQGLISIASGKKNITTQNFKISSSSSSLASYAGWLYGDSCASSASSGTYTVSNCSSNGPIPTDGGGIIGRNFLLSASGCTLTVTKCFSVGAIATSNAGGICGYYFLNGSSSCTVTIQNCYSLGSIAGAAGGIIGGSCCVSTPGSSSVTVQNCYSLGNIGSGAGGIVGPSAIYTTVSNCYSTGTGTTNTGAIFGSSTGATCVASRCYASGASASSIMGSSSSGTVSNCYSEAANSSSGWSDTHALSVLQSYGTIWLSVSANTQWFLLAFNAAVYASLNQSAVPSSNGTVTSYAGLFSSPYTYTIVAPPSNFSINSSTGVITGTSQTPPQTYQVYVYASYTGANYDYNISLLTFNIISTVLSQPFGFSGTRVINTIYDAKRRTRAGGAVAPKKKGAYTGQSIF